MGIGLSHSYETFLLFRLAIGMIGASFVITQYHTSIMFAPNVVGTANAATAGWGNLGGGVTQIAMPLIFAAIISLGAGKFLGWRLAMVVPGVVLFFTGIAYYFFTQDAPDGNFKELRERGELPAAEDKEHGSFLLAAKDPRVWALFVVYAACFGVEITIDNIAALYFFDRFELSLETAGIIAGLFGLMNIFARALGGIFSDKFAKNHGLTGRVRFLFAVLFMEGLALVLFSQMSVLVSAVISMVFFGLFVKMSNGATYGVVPFVNKKALGSVAGIVGAGGNAGAVAAGFLFRSESLTMQAGLFYLGLCVVIASLFVFFIRFSPETIEQEKKAFQEAQAQKAAAVGS
jgi:NNP family nitrate/nitrite transporter-like MFS transporter